MMPHPSQFYGVAVVETQSAHVRPRCTMLFVMSGIKSVKVDYISVQFGSNRFSSVSRRSSHLEWSAFVSGCVKCY